MSLAREDWKRFDMLSGQAKIGDAAGSGDVICNVSGGEWVAMCEYDDENKIAYVAAMRDYLADMMSGGSVAIDGTHEEDAFDSKSGVVFIIDRKMDGHLPPGFKCPEHKLNPEIVERYGKPDDNGKSDNDRFIEAMFHLGRDHASRMPSLESLGCGAVFELGKGGVHVDLLYNAMRDVIGFEIQRKEQ